ncbi:MAG: hypothetical protein ACXW00_11310 [Methylobacter sp.]|jgi:hypothetical protein
MGYKKMNSITKKMLLIGVVLLLSACAHDSHQYAYYPSNTAYSSGYTIMHRNYYGERPDHYDNGYRQENNHFPHQHHHDQYSAKQRWGGNYQAPRHQQHDRDHDHRSNDDNNRLKYGNSRQHNDGGNGRRNSFYRKDYHH